MPADLELEPPAESPADARRIAILEAAFDCFCRYGFRRTAMEDIARAAGLSRAALYLHFANKTDIHRSLIRHYFDVTEARICAALRPGLPPETALAAAFAAKAGPELVAMHASPHGAELLDLNTQISADVVHEGEGRLARALADWLRVESAAGRIALDEPAEGFAALIVAALNGLKSASGGMDAYREGSARLARVLGRSLTR